VGELWMMEEVNRKQEAQLSRNKARSRRS